MLGDASVMLVTKATSHTKDWSCQSQPASLQFIPKMNTNMEVEPAGSSQGGFTQQSVDMESTREGSKSLQAEKYTYVLSIQYG